MKNWETKALVLIIFTFGAWGVLYAKHFIFNKNHNVIFTNNNTTNLSQDDISDKLSVSRAMPLSSSQKAQVAVTSQSLKTADVKYFLGIDLVSELKVSPELEKFSKNSGIVILLDSENRDAESFVRRASSNDVLFAREGSKLLIERMSQCLLEVNHCGFDTSQWESSYGMGGPPAFYILERGLNLILAIKENHPEISIGVSRKALLQSMAVPSSSVSLLAASLIFKDSVTDDEILEVLDQSKLMRAESRPIVYQIALQEAEARNGEPGAKLVKNHILQTFADPSEQDTQDELLSSLYNYELEKNDLITIAKSLCHRDKANEFGEDFNFRRRLTLQKQAKMQGYKISVKQICST